MHGAVLLGELMMVMMFLDRREKSFKNFIIIKTTITHSVSVTEPAVTEGAVPHSGHRSGVARRS